MTNQAKFAPPLVQAGSVRVYPGFAFGMRQPAVLVTLHAAPMDDPVWTTLPVVWHQEALWCDVTRLPGLPPSWHQMSDDLAKVGLWLTFWPFRLQFSAGIPVFEPGRVIGLLQSSGQTSVLRLLLPIAPGRTAAAQKAFQITLEMFNTSLVAARAGMEEPTREDGRLSAALNELSAADKVEEHTWRFIRAAFDSRIPWQWLGADSYQFGQGRSSRWLNVTITDVTAAMSVKMARNKDWSANVLRLAGLPVAPHALVADADSAVHLAGRLGYPVVVKPADTDGGAGVMAGLASEGEVRHAFQCAREISASVIVEKHIYGRDYRLTVLNGCLVWAIERRPAGVVGDGIASIQELVAQTNAARVPGAGPFAGLKQLEMDDNARKILFRQGLDATSIPEAGRFVFLRNNANIATGGTPLPVMHDVHPDNAHLAVRAAQALRLDLAGVDLLIPDISRSWREVGGVICEVNAGPQLGVTTAPHIYGEILTRLIPGTGRIPILVVLGGAPDIQLVEVLARDWEAMGHHVGCSDDRGVYCGGHWLTRGRVDAFAAGQMLLVNQKVTAIILTVNDGSILLQGLPMDRYDFLLLAGTYLHPPQRGEAQGPPESIMDLLAALLPACRHRILTLSGPAQGLSPPKSALFAQWRPEPLQVEEVARALRAELALRSGS